MRSSTTISNKAKGHNIFRITAELISHSVWSKAMVNKSTDHGNDVMVVQFVFLFLCTCRTLCSEITPLHLSFKHFTVGKSILTMEKCCLFVNLYV